MFLTGKSHDGYSAESRIDSDKKIVIRAKKDNAEHCVCCGAVVPEGREICPLCEAGRTAGVNPS